MQEETFYTLMKNMSTSPEYATLWKLNNDISHL